MIISLYLLSLATQSFALQLTIPSTFGGKTDFSDWGWRSLIKDLSSDVKLGQAPVAQITTDAEATCGSRLYYCSTSYFGKEITLNQPSNAQLWVKWHQDATPFACNSPDGCTVSSATSVADLSSQTNGWSVTATVNLKIGTNFDKPTWNGELGGSVSYQYSDSKTVSTTITSTRTLSSVCSQDNLCFLQTGTLMMSVSGVCDQKPLIVCDRDYYPCHDFNGISLCSQWAQFTNRNCLNGFPRQPREQCSMNVAVKDENGQPISFQVFEQRPINNKRSIEKRDYVPAGDPFGPLPDGSSGAWMAWSA